MKCETVQELLSRYLSGELNDLQRASVGEHVADCASCRESLAFHRSLSSQMAVSGAPSAALYDRVSREVSIPRPGLLTRIFGDPTMKKILISSTAVTAC